MKLNRIISAVVVLAMVLSFVPAFAASDDTQESGSETIVAVHYYGDTNFNDVLNTADASEILRMCADLIQPTEEQMALTYEGFSKIDANKDGNLNTSDASYILQVSADMKLANEYYDKAQTEPTGEPTTEPTGEPTGEPTANPTIAPSAAPTAEPTETPDAYITVNCYDTFNEMEGKSGLMGLYEGTTVITAENIQLPTATGYVLDEDDDFSVTVTVTNGVADTEEINVNVIPMAYDSENNIYKVIYTIAGFNKVNDDLAGNYALGANIDLEGEIRYPFGWNWEDDTQDDQVFTGIFHGNNHVIENLYMDFTYTIDEETETVDMYENVGLFGLNAGTICNLVLCTKFFSGDEHYGVFGDANVGAVAGQNAGIIKDCYVFGNVGSMDNIYRDHGAAGGICGENFGVITRCSFEGGMEGFYWIGGICGKNFGKISECYFAGDINAAADAYTMYYYEVQCIGGICGGSQDGDIRNCYVYCSSRIYGDFAVGGLIGWLSGGEFHNAFIVKSRIEYCEDDGGHDDIGALVSMPNYSGIYCRDNAVLPMPKEFGEEWDMHAASHNTFPDLVQHRRLDKFFVD